jgi:regulatory protein
VSGRNRGRPGRPLDEETLERLALFYVGRFATTRAKLRTYLTRKLRERGWQGSGEPALVPLVERLSALGYIDDAAFASARAASLQRRGYGERRVAQMLAAAGIEDAEAAPAREQAHGLRLESALRFAEKRRIGPFAPARMDRPGRERAFAAMARAGHPIDIIRKVLDALPGEIPELET